MPSPQARTDEPWWKSGVIYQIYPRSFADPNGDGVGVGDSHPARLRAQSHV
jgi:alpha-glucosidase